MTASSGHTSGCWPTGRHWQRPTRGRATRPNWTAAGTCTNSVTLGTDPPGNTISYLIHRLCQCANVGYNDPCAASPTGQNQCALENPVAAAMPAPEQGDSFSTGASVYGADSKVYYRITVRSSGPRGTVSYIQAMVAVAL